MGPISISHSQRMLRRLGCILLVISFLTGDGWFGDGRRGLAKANDPAGVDAGSQAQRAQKDGRSKRAEARPIHSIHEEYEADFSNGKERGVGVRFSIRNSETYVDLRLLGFPGSEPKRRGDAYEFAAAPGIRVLYQTDAQAVKETIVLARNEPSEFRFKLSSPGTTAKQVEDEIWLATPSHPALFRLTGTRAWDATGAEIPATMTLEGEEVALRVDPSVLSQSVPPITIDPTIEGATTSMPHARTLFVTEDGRIIFFYRDSGGKVVYRTSSDRGTTWNSPVQVSEATGIGISVAEAEPDVFLVAWASGASQPTVFYRELVPDGNGGWSVGPLRELVSNGVQVWPFPTVVYRGQGPLGRRVAVGFQRVEPTLLRAEYVASLSENSGETWTLPSPCSSDNQGTLAALGQRLLCITTATRVGLHWTELIGATWGPQQTISLPGYPVIGYAPSALAGKDGQLHLVVGATNYLSTGTKFRNGIFYTNLTQSGNSWSPIVELGEGTAPMISESSNALHVFAYASLWSNESWIRSYTSADGTNWIEGTPHSGRPFKHVFDYNTSWAFSQKEGGALFTLRDDALFGNRIGTTSPLHRIDSPNNKLAMRFPAQQSGNATAVKLWLSSQGNGSYRVGIQSDSNGFPSGDWLNQVEAGGVVVSGSYADIAGAPTAVPTALSIELSEEGELLQGHYYHLVVEPAPDPLGLSPPGPNRWLGIEAVGTDLGAEGEFRVHSFSSSGWSTEEGETPRFVVVGAGQILGRQEIAASTTYPVTEYSLPGEFLTAPSNASPTEARVFLKKVGNPTDSITLRLLNESQVLVWSAEMTPLAQGWMSVPMSGVTLSAGSRYRLILDSRNRDTQNYWGLGTAMDYGASPPPTSVSWASDRPGFNNRSDEASDKTAGSGSLTP